MKYQAPFGSTDPNASYVDRNTPGAVRGSAVPALAIEDPQREIADLISKCGLTPTELVLQLARAVQSGKLNYVAAGGTANALTVTLSPAPAAYADIVGMPLRVKLASANTAAMTINVNGLGAKDVVRSDGSPIASGDFAAGAILALIYDGTAFQLDNISSLNVTPPGTGVYLSYVSTTSIRLAPANGGILWINGKNYPVPASLTLSNSGVANSTLYYIYAYMNAGVMTLERSTTGYTLAANGMPQKTGDATRTLVGLVYTTSSGTFAGQGIGVISYFNRRAVFVASNGAQTGTTTSTTPVELNVNARATFLTWADALSLAIIGYGSNANASKAFFSGIAVDGTVVAQIHEQIYPVAGTQSMIAQSINFQMSEGLHYATIFGAAASASTANYAGLGTTVLLFG